MRLVYLALGWCAGILLAANTAARPAAVWAMLVFLALVGFWLVRPIPGQRLLAAALVAFTLGGLRFSFVPVSSSVAAYNNSGGLTLTGFVASEPDVRDDRVQFVMETNSVTRAGQTVNTSGRVLVQIDRTLVIGYGRMIAVTGELITPAEYDTFSYADYLARTSVFSIMPNAAVEYGDGYASSPPLYNDLLNIKHQAADHIAHYLPEPQAGLLTGILLGTEGGIAQELSDAFGAVGASHIIAISGFNMVILSGVVLALFKRLYMPDPWAALIAIVLIALYTLLVGANAAVMRAALMSALLVIGALIKRRTYVPASLALVAILLSVLNPTVLWDISFQLSFFATLGLALFANPLSRGFDRLLRRVFPSSAAASIGSFLAEPLMVTLAVQITTLPLILLYFARFSPVSLVVNLLVVPVQAYLLVLGLLATLVAFVLPLLAQLLYWFDLVLLSWTITIVRLFAAVPFADVEFHVDPRLISLYFVLLLGGALMQATQPTWAIKAARIIRRRPVFTALLFAGVSVLVLTAAVFFSRPDGRLHVWFLDVGHSNAVFVQTPGGAHILIDGGRFPARLLTALGDRMPFNDREIEVLAVTQPDEFDTSALIAVQERYQIGLKLSSGQPNLSETFAHLQNSPSVQRSVVVQAGYWLEVDDGVRLDVLHPQIQPTLDDSLDAQALVLRLSYRNVSFLLTGDLSRAGQDALLAAGRWPLATVMQLPRHGGARSLEETFLQAAQPQVFVLQSDRANRLGDPDPDTLSLLGNRSLFRTDQGGTIHIWTDGHKLQIVQER